MEHHSDANRSVGMNQRACGDAFFIFAAMLSLFSILAFKRRNNHICDTINKKDRRAWTSKHSSSP